LLTLLSNQYLQSTYSSTQRGRADEHKLAARSTHWQPPATRQRAGEHSDFGNQDREFKHTSNRRHQSEPPQAFAIPDTGYSTDTEPRPSASLVEAAAA